MATLAPVRFPGPDGIAVAYAAATAGAGGDQFANTGQEKVIFKQGAGARVVTILAQNDPYGRGFGTHDKVINVGANTEHAAGPFPPELYNDANGRVQIRYDAVTNTSVALVI